MSELEKNWINWETASRESWRTLIDGRFPGMEEIKVGCLKRIADSLEAINRNICDLKYKQSCHYRDIENLKKRVREIRKAIKP